MFQQYHLYSMDMSGDKLLDSQPVIVPNSLQSNCVSPTTFSTQLVRKLGIRGTNHHEAEAANLNDNNNTIFRLDRHRGCEHKNMRRLPPV